MQCTIKEITEYETGACWLSQNEALQLAIISFSSYSAQTLSSTLLTVSPDPEDVGYHTNDYETKNVSVAHELKDKSAG